MKTRETKQNDLVALTESLQNSTSAMVVSFSGVTVAKDQEFRKSLREAGAKYEVVKNTLARIAVQGTQFEEASEFFKGVTAIAWTDSDPIVLTKAISKFMKDNEKQYTFKTGVIDGKLVDLTQLTTIANLPSKDELIAKLLFVLNSSAQRIITVINAVPRDLAVVIKQIGESKPASAVAAAPAVEAKAEELSAAPAIEEVTPAEAEVSAEAPTAEEAPVEAAADTTEAVAEPADEAPAVEAEAAPAAEVAEPAEEAPAEVEAAAEETTEAATEEATEPAPEADAEEKAE